jgi:hypothetical protein
MAHVSRSSSPATTAAGGAATPSSSPRRAFGRRLALWGAAAVTTTAMALGLSTASAVAKEHDPCATAKAIVQADLNEARFWIVALDGLAEARFDWLAGVAESQRDHYMGMAEDDYTKAKAACG